METKFQTSFIPKKPITLSTPYMPGASYTPNIFFVISIVILVLALLLYGGVFLYEKYLNSKIEGLKTILADAGTSFDKSQIKKFEEVDKKIRSAETLLARHVAPSLFFKILQSITLESVRFKDLSFSSAPPNQVTISLNGEARSYAALAVESQVILKNAYIKNAVFSDLKLGQSGTVLFRLGATVKPEAILYENEIPKTSPQT